MLTPTLLETRNVGYRKHPLCGTRNITVKLGQVQRMDALAQIPDCARGYWYNEIELRLISGLPKDEFERCRVTKWKEERESMGYIKA